LILKLLRVGRGYTSFVYKLAYVGRKGANAESFLPEMQAPVYYLGNRMDRERFKEVREMARKMAKEGGLYHRVMVLAPEDPEFPQESLRLIADTVMRKVYYPEVPHYVVALHRHGEDGEMKEILRNHAHILFWGGKLGDVYVNRSQLRSMKVEVNVLETQLRKSAKPGVPL